MSSLFMVEEHSAFGAEMKRVCAWCHKNLGETSDFVAGDINCISHGICQDCLDNVKDSSRLHLRELMNMLPEPVFLIDSEGRARSANEKALEFIGKNYVDIEDALGGDVIACAYASLPGGCGQTEHCAACTIRNTVNKTAETGQDQVGVVAHQPIATSAGQRMAEIVLSTEKVSDWVFMRIDSMRFLDADADGEAA